MSPWWLCAPRCAIHLPAAAIAAYAALHPIPACNERCATVTIPAREWRGGGFFAPGGRGFGLVGAPLAAQVPATPGILPLGDIGETAPGFWAVPGSSPAPIIVAPVVREQPVPVPEPATWMVFGGAALALVLIRRPGRPG